MLVPDRASVHLMASDLDSLLPPDHNALAVWAYVQRMDLSSLYEGIRARGSHPGRPAIDQAFDGGAFTRLVRWAADGAVAGNPVVMIDIIAKD